MNADSTRVCQTSQSCAMCQVCDAPQRDGNCRRHLQAQPAAAGLSHPVDQLRHLLRLQVHHAVEAQDHASLGQHLSTLLSILLVVSSFPAIHSDTTHTLNRGAAAADAATVGAMYTYNIVPAAPNKTRKYVLQGHCGDMTPPGCRDETPWHHSSWDTHCIMMNWRNSSCVMNGRSSASLARASRSCVALMLCISVTAAVRRVERVSLRRTQPSWTSLCAFNSRPEAAALMPWCSGTLPMAG